MDKIKSELLQDGFLLKKSIELKKEVKDGEIDIKKALKKFKVIVLSHYQHINPCIIDDKNQTLIFKDLKDSLNENDIKKLIISIYYNI